MVCWGLFLGPLVSGNSQLFQHQLLIVASVPSWNPVKKGCHACLLQSADSPADHAMLFGLSLQANTARSFGTELWPHLTTDRYMFGPLTSVAWSGAACRPNFG